MSKIKQPSETDGIRQSITESRKARHVELVVREHVEHRNKRTGLGDLDFVHNALPELAFNEIETKSSFLGHFVEAPLIISSMTGGYSDATEINSALACACDRYGLAMGVGSERQALENTQHHRSFSIVREAAPNAFIFANIGATEVARLHSERKIEQLQMIVDLVQANALAIHLNPLQELLQPEGSRNFCGVLDGVAECVNTFGLPIIVKEVGAGISRSVAEKLLEVGVRAIDVAGAGGTSWAGVEILRNNERAQAELDPFWDWGISTVDAIEDVFPLKHEFEFELIASGGIRNGLDIAKSLVLGADAAAIARPLIQAFIDGGEEALFAIIDTLLYQLRAVMFLTGSRDIASLKQQQLLSR
jgi:isopentenyl-diphosphate Delta-isomerase